MPDKLPLGPTDQQADPVDYYVPASKDGVACGARIDPAQKQRIATIVQSGKTRFQNESDIVRAALHYFMLEIVAPRMDGRFQQDMRLAAAAVRRAQVMARIHDATKFARDVISCIRSLVLQGAIQQAVEVWLDTDHVIEASAEPFRTKAREVLLADSELASIPGLAAVRSATEHPTTHEPEPGE